MQLLHVIKVIYQKAHFINPQKLLSFFCFFFTINLISAQQIEVTKSLCENKINPIGIETDAPRLTWILASSKRNVKQSAYQIQVSEKEKSLKNTILWDSGKIITDQSVHVNYNGPKLISLKKYYWRVRVWNQNNKVSKWSTINTWQMGLLNIFDWQAEWIEVSSEKSENRPSPLFRNKFKVTKEIESATAIITSHGLYIAYINGKKIGDSYFTPGWTSYNKRLQYQTYDVTSLLQKGDNAIGAILGSGWYRGTLAWEGNKDLYGKNLALLLQINLKYADGTSETVGTNKNWKTTTGEILTSEIYNGELIDARHKKKGWNLPDYNDQDWKLVHVVSLDKNYLVATINEPIRKQETFKPIDVIITPEGDHVLDFGQNLVGFVQIKVKGKKGDEITLKHAEILDKNGNFYTENLRAAKQENKYILNGENVETFEPHFTWQGFRYVSVKGISGKINPENFTAVALYSDMQQTGSFTTSNELINKLQHNIEWGQKGNFLDVPTDCPQRDERLGWTGDAQVFFNTASFNMQVDNFFAKWMKDVEADQLKNGSVPHVIPNVLNSNDSGSAGWADVATIIPWDMYLNYGDKKILKDQYNSMKAWVDYITSQSKDFLWNSGTHFGDWLYYIPEKNDTETRSAETDKFLIAQCFYANSTQIMINTSLLLNKPDDFERYTTLLKNIKQAFIKKYTSPDGVLSSNSQTAYVLALQFDMLPENMRAQAAKHLADNIKSYDYHLTTGFLGTPYLCHVLTRFGYHDLAYTLLMQKTYPSWLYPVTMGATTIWERWDGQKPNGDFQTPAMNSFNHYAYGAIGDWMYKTLGGIKSSTSISEVGYKKSIIKPYIYNKLVSKNENEQTKDEQLTMIQSNLETYYGKISSHWQNNENQIYMDITIPVNTSAELHIPSNNIESVIEGDSKLSKSENVKIIETTSTEIIVALGSGSYHFTIKK
ncbi:family 78 glycoside hydrolase catalytic domain [Mariniflexile litorale]|uniref:alpha-L-rhamnosidase n=1 Tax=Mariniflexile litorale TaxID=3045158 RepID=A0AAU7EGV7_9FLAO|nr:family 78 glycoside hydrolase catalytic domain [Mariniflexile sp. KMM 9835]MDQ8211939.1 family 78 glycoside hydrolase catalytic domain [Mariniflexile sp. KMM 9835]